MLPSPLDVVSFGILHNSKTVFVVVFVRPSEYITFCIAIHALKIEIVKQRLAEMRVLRPK